MSKWVAIAVAVVVALGVLGGREFLTHSDRAVGFLTSSELAPTVCSAPGVHDACAARVLAQLEVESNAARARGL